MILHSNVQTALDLQERTCSIVQTHVLEISIHKSTGSAPAEQPLQYQYKISRSASTCRGRR